MSTADAFFIAKGVIAFTGALLLVAHMWQDRQKPMQLGQRLRYISLLTFAVSIVGRSAIQVQDHREVDGGAKTAFACATVLLVAMVVSIKESNQRA